MVSPVCIHMYVYKNKYVILRSSYVFMVQEKSSCYDHLAKVKLAFTVYITLSPFCMLDTSSLHSTNMGSPPSLSASRTCVGNG